MKMLKSVKYMDEERFGLDTDIFHFYSGRYSGLTESPNKDSLPGKLVGISYKIASLARENDKEKQEEILKDVVFKANNLIKLIDAQSKEDSQDSSGIVHLGPSVEPPPVDVQKNAE
jgi:hypothetical protein